MNAKDLLIQKQAYDILKLRISNGTNEFSILSKAGVMVSKSLFHEILERISRLTLVAVTPGAG